MKILHTSDLHIGKRINGFSMLEDQKDILEKIVSIVAQEQPDAIILAGDLYDKSVPAAEAVTLLDNFLVALARQKKPIFLISGNHDSAERIAFASRLMSACDVYVSPVYDGHIEPIVLTDGEGQETAFYLLPFIKPSTVAHFADEGTTFGTYDEAMRYVIGNLTIDKSRRNVLVTHQFITDAKRSESEDIPVGGLDNINADVFDAFDYVALGHLHCPQDCGSARIRYSGSPLKYSFSEVDDAKSVSLVTLGATTAVEEIPLTPLHEWHDIRGTYDELTAKDFYDGTDYQDSYLRITLTDDNDIPDGMRKLQAIYPYLMELRYDNKRTRAQSNPEELVADVQKSPLDLLAELYLQQNGQALSDEQQAYADQLIQSVWN